MNARTNAKRWYAVRVTYPMSSDFAAIDRELYEVAGRYSDEAGAGKYRDHGWGADSMAEAQRIARRVSSLDIRGLAVKIRTGVGDVAGDVVPVLKLDRKRPS